MQTIAYIGIGSNVGDRLGFLRAAVAEFRRKDCDVLRASSVYETEPVGFKEQGWFLNAVLEVGTFLPVRSFHSLLKSIESDVGRKPTTRWGPREIDLDLLLFGEEVVDEERLVVPHPQIPARRFVLAPLAELAGETRHPTLGFSVEELCERVDDPADVRRIAAPDALIGLAFEHTDASGRSDGETNETA